MQRSKTVEVQYIRMILVVSLEISKQKLWGNEYPNFYSKLFGFNDDKKIIRTIKYFMKNLLFVFESIKFILQRVGD
jgi:hypothetical protein